MNRVAQRIAFAAQLRLHGEDVTYTTADGTTHQLRAVRGQTPFRESATGNNGGRIVRSTDWIFDTAAFRTALGRWPVEGEKITAVPPRELAGLTSTTFRVAPVNGEPCYRTDPTYSQLRVHTQEHSEQSS